MTTADPGPGAEPLPLDRAAALVRDALDDPDTHHPSPDAYAADNRPGLWVPVDTLRVLLEHAETSLDDDAASEPLDVGDELPKGRAERSSRSNRYVSVRCADDDPVEFHTHSHLSSRAAGHHHVTEVLERWTERSRWPFLSAMPLGGDRVRVWRVYARLSAAPHSDPIEVVLRMRAGPGVWDARIPGAPRRRKASRRRG